MPRSSPDFPPPATLTWVDLTTGDRDRMQRVLDLFDESGTRDDLGIGSLRDAVSDALFPGTSYIQTRLRYVLFIPWIYRRLEARRGRPGGVERDARQAEIDLIGALDKSRDRTGIIGVKARHNLTRLPSSAYWTALTRWGLFTADQSQGWYHFHFGRLADSRESTDRADDPGVVWSREPHWHPRLPAPPFDFPDAASFAVTPDEADFLRGRLEERCGGTLLAWLAREGSDAPANSFWDDPDALRAPRDMRETVELARRFSLHVKGMPLVYNLLVTERRRDVLEEGGSADGTDGTIEDLRAAIPKWAAREAAEVRAFEHEALWDLVARRGGRLPDPQRRFVEGWSRRIAEIAPEQVADDKVLRELVTHRETSLKGRRARLAEPANRSRLLDWQPDRRGGRMDFRWYRVRQLLTDLHRGLAG